MNLWIKIPAVKRAVLNLEAEIRERDAFGEQLIEENEKLTSQLKAMQQTADSWGKRWQDEHEKYLDLCEQFREAMETMKGALENVLAHTTIDT